MHIIDCELIARYLLQERAYALLFVSLWGPLSVSTVKRCGHALGRKTGEVEQYDHAYDLDTGPILADAEVS